MDTSTVSKQLDLWRAARIFASILVLMTAAYYLIVAFDNITNPSSNWPFVQGVLSGDGTPPDDGFEWREISANWFAVISYIGIILGETLAGLILLYAGIQGLRSSSTHQRWSRFQPAALLGCIIGLAVFYLGFITIGGNWFIMYLNDTWNGLDPAFQNTVTTLGTAIIVILVSVGGRLSIHSGEAEEEGTTLPTHSDDVKSAATHSQKEAAEAVDKTRHGLAS